VELELAVFLPQGNYGLLSHARTTSSNVDMGQPKHFDEKLCYIELANENVYLNYSIETELWVRWQNIEIVKETNKRDALI
jgi:hypothetical protein